MNIHQLHILLIDLHTFQQLGKKYGKISKAFKLDATTHNIEEVAKLVKELKKDFNEG